MVSLLSYIRFVVLLRFGNNTILRLCLVLVASSHTKNSLLRIHHRRIVLLSCGNNYYMSHTDQLIPEYRFYRSHQNCRTHYLHIQQHSADNIRLGDSLVDRLLVGHILQFHLTTKYSNRLWEDPYNNCTTLFLRL